MCYMSNSSPLPPVHPEQQCSGLQEMWDLLYKHNAIFLGDDKLNDELVELLKKHHIKLHDPTPGQSRMLQWIDKLVKKRKLNCV